MISDSFFILMGTAVPMVFATFSISAGLFGPSGVQVSGSFKTSPPSSESDSMDNIDTT